MAGSRVKLVLDQFSTSPHACVEIDGRSFLTSTRALKLQAAVGELTTLELDLLVVEAEVHGQIKVLIPDSTREALVALGWTPPTDEAKS